MTLQTPSCHQAGLARASSPRNFVPTASAALASPSWPRMLFSTQNPSRLPLSDHLGCPRSSKLALLNSAILLQNVANDPLRSRLHSISHRRPSSVALVECLPFEGTRSRRSRPPSMLAANSPQRLGRSPKFCSTHKHTASKANCSVFHLRPDSIEVAHLVAFLIIRLLTSVGGRSTYDRPKVRFSA